ncbi:regulatory protein, luxR family [Lentzea flava]|nr:regulatory protein, luxR family [Lentzea flava]
MLSPMIMPHVIDFFTRGDRDKIFLVRGRIAALTKREREILGFVVRGARNAEIARSIAVSEGAVKAP